MRSDFAFVLRRHNRHGHALAEVCTQDAARKSKVSLPNPTRFRIEYRLGRPGVADRRRSPRASWDDCIWHSGRSAWPGPGAVGSDIIVVDGQ
jgi:hypothetical protein